MSNNNVKKTVIRSTRFSPALMDMVKKECAYRGIDFSNYIRNAATVAMRHNKTCSEPLVGREGCFEFRSSSQE